jgi:hypothetical protein
VLLAHLRGARPPLVRGDVEQSELGEPLQGQDVRGIGEVLGVGEDDLFDGARGNGEHPGGELVASRLLEQRRILLSVQKILVGLARGGELDHLALLPGVAHAHREPAQRRLLRERHAEGSLERTIEGVLEREVELGEREGPFDDDVGAKLGEPKPRAVGCGEAHGRLGLRGDLQRGRHGDLKIVVGRGLVAETRVSRIGGTAAREGEGHCRDEATESLTGRGHGTSGSR